jgi:hypothetical protein
MYDASPPKKRPKLVADANNRQHVKYSVKRLARLAVRPY